MAHVRDRLCVDTAIRLKQRRQPHPNQGGELCSGDLGGAVDLPVLGGQPRELGPRGITVNAIAPGYLRTEMSAALGEDDRVRIVRRTPAGRLGEAADIAPLALFLASRHADFITGQTLVVDGGLTC